MGATVRPGAEHPRVLHVETGYIEGGGAGDRADILDYTVYQGVPRWWRRLESLLRTDLYLALRARRAADEFDLIWAGSEKVAIPLSLLGVSKPLVVVAHFMEAPYRSIPARLFGLTKRWAAIGYVSDASKAFFMDFLGVPESRLFQYYAARTLDVPPPPEACDGPIISVGTAKRDYKTLVAALGGLPGRAAELFVSSRYGDGFRGRLQDTLPAWVTLMQPVSEAELLEHYRRARFAVIPLVKTRHSGAGISAALEAAVCGKAVVATRTAGMASYVIDGETGILVAPGDIDAMRAAVERLWADPALASKMGRAGRRYVEGRFDPEKVSRNTRGLLLRIHQHSQGPASRLQRSGAQ